MRILFRGNEYYLVGGMKPKGNTIVAGYAVGDNGKLREGVEDITQYDEEGNEILPEIEFDEAEGVPV